MGYYGCNNAGLKRTTMAGRRVIHVMVVHDDLSDSSPHKTEIHTVDGWDRNAVELATRWLVEKLSQLSM